MKNTGNIIKKIISELNLFYKAQASVTVLMKIFYVRVSSNLQESWVTKRDFRPHMYLWFVTGLAVNISRGIL